MRPARIFASRGSAAALVGALVLTGTASPAVHRLAYADAPVFHLRLTKSEPARGDTLRATPTVVKLWFSQKPEMSVTGVRLLTTDGKDVALSVPRLEGEKQTLVVADVNGTVPSGSLRVSWRTSSSDGHIIKGEIPFQLRIATSGGTP